MPTILGLMILPLTALWAGNPVRLIQAAMVASIFQAGCAVILGGSFGLPVAMVPCLMFLVYVMAQYAAGMRYGAEGAALLAVIPLIALLAYAVLSMLLLPDAFAGMVMVYPQRPDPLDGGVVPLAFNFGNVTQTLYLSMNVTTTIVVAVFMTRFAIPYDAIISGYLLGGYLVVGLAVYQFISRISGIPFLTDVLYSNPSYAIVEQSMGVVPRVQGPFSEPSALASYLSGLCFCCLWLTAHGHRLMRVNILLGLSIVAMLLSTSTTGIVSLVIGIPLILVIAAAGADRRSMARLGKTSAILFLAGLIAIGPAFILKPDLVDAVNEVVDTTLAKRDSDSYNDRTDTDIAALDTVAQTYGLGVGWGSFRSSSLVPGLLANGGVFSVVMVLWMGFRVARLSSRAKAKAPAHPGRAMVDGFSAALCGTFTAALVSTPTIDTLAFYLQLGCVIGTCARMSVESRPTGLRPFVTTPARERAPA